MPLLGFTKLKEKLLDDSKTQTIRKPRKNPIKVGDKLFIYWKLRTKECEKLGEAIVTKMEHKSIYELTEEDAIKDGFENRGGLIQWLMENYYYLNPLVPPKERDQAFKFDVITFEWTRKEQVKP